VISIDWQSILAYLLLSVSGLGGIAWGGKAAWTKLKTFGPKPEGETTRAADEPAPPGSVVWVNDIEKHMGDASAESKLKALRNGYTRAEALQLRISELEATP
jgi:hypothetical protein